ncbi:polysaccharide biosynthesis protein [Halalkalibacterium halodurans]|uniref:polysaccharide biosynthesis protein n=1 Tax=Halalkalibacterium halodurans TaxID=86665 RepID=UPI002E1DE3E4|nr:polysaccharide biosynthesis protein [Halalkalibacterium halodurans]MED4171499.1 polysaccharide biosynthesis protein [Halalkalibacterium halodurans]
MNMFVRGAALLIAAAFISECLEFLINMVLARELGEEGLGHYMALLPTIVFLFVIASMELPISVSKFVAEKEEGYHRSMLQQTLKFATMMTVIFLVAAIVIFPLLSVFESYHPAVRWLLLLLIPIVSFSSVARGYFMGAQHMGKIAIANFLRRSVQLLLLLVVFQLFLFDTEVAIFIALCTVVATELVVLLFLLIYFFVGMKKMKGTSTKSISQPDVRRALLAVSLPTTGLRIFHAASFAIKPFLIKIALMNAGLMESTAIIQYGKLAGVAFTIGFFPGFIAHSLLTVLIPTVAEAYSKGDMDRLQRLLTNVMLGTFVYAVPSVLVFYFFANELTSLFFEASPAAVYLQLLVPYFFFHFFVIPMQAFLIGLGMMKDAFYHSVWATVVSYVLMYVLGSMPQLQMDGIIIGMNTGVVMLTLMHLLTIRYKMQEPQSWKLSRA